MGELTIPFYTDLYIKQVHFKNHRLVHQNYEDDETLDDDIIEVDKNGNEVSRTLPITYAGTYENGCRYCLIITNDMKGLIVDELPFRSTDGTRIYSVATDCITIAEISHIAAGELSIENAINDNFGGSISGNRKEILNDKDIPINHIPYVKECIDYLAKSAMNKRRWKKN